MDWSTIILIPTIGAFIGWITNLIAVKAIFKPYQPVRIFGLPWAIQGVVPKRRAELARSIGEVVENELLNMQDIVAQMKSPEILGNIVEKANESIRTMIIERIPAWVPGTVRMVIMEMMGDMLNKQMPKVINQIVDEAGENVVEKIRPGKLVEERMNDYEIQHIEKLILSVASKELKHIEILGGVLGFLIGLIQVAVVRLSA